jgi:small subunit ribosomal protein S3
MGHKVHPLGYRIGITENWRSKWFTSKKNLGDWIIEDYKIRKHISEKFGKGRISKIEIERGKGSPDKVQVIIHTREPGRAIGKSGKMVSEMEADLSKMVNKDVKIDIVQMTGELDDAQLIAENIARELERRRPHRRVMHRFAQMVMEQGAKGIKIQIKGRIAGIEIARKEKLSMGKLPLTTLRSIIDYGVATANLKKGTVGVKVWIYKGEKFDTKLE